jgi:hypothetical protein
MRSVLTVNPTLALSRLGQDPYEMTTQAAGAVFPFVMQQGLRDLRGVVVGMNVLAGGAFVFDPFRAYANGLVTNPNMAIFGSPGQGKSALVKTLLSRMDALSGGVKVCGDHRPERRVHRPRRMARLPGPLAPPQRRCQVEPARW